MTTLPGKLHFRLQNNLFQSTQDQKSNTYMPLVYTWTRVRRPHNGFYSSTTNTSSQAQKQSPWNPTGCLQQNHIVDMAISATVFITNYLQLKSSCRFSKDGETTFIVQLNINKIWLRKGRGEKKQAMVITAWAYKQSFGLIMKGHRIYYLLKQATSKATAFTLCPRCLHFRHLLMSTTVTRKELLQLSLS